MWKVGGLGILNAKGGKKISIDTPDIKRPSFCSNFGSCGKFDV